MVGLGGIYHEWWMDMLLKFELIQFTMNSKFLKAGVGRHDVLAQLRLTNSKQCTFQLQSNDTTHYRPWFAGLTGLSTGCCGPFRWWCGVPFYDGCNFRHANTGSTVIWGPHELLGWCYRLSALITVRLTLQALPTWFIHLFNICPCQLGGEWCLWSQDLMSCAWRICSAWEQLLIAQYQQACRGAIHPWRVEIPINLPRFWSLRKIVLGTSTRVGPIASLYNNML